MFIVTCYISFSITWYIWIQTFVLWIMAGGHSQIRLLYYQTIQTPYLIKTTFTLFTSSHSHPRIHMAPSFTSLLTVFTTTLTSCSQLHWQFTGPGESDMDLDLMAESESDSESSHSNQDNVSIQRSAVTAATAGSDAGQFQMSRCWGLGGDWASHRPVEYKFCAYLARKVTPELWCHW